MYVYVMWSLCEVKNALGGYHLLDVAAVALLDALLSACTHIKTARHYIAQINKYQITKGVGEAGCGGCLSASSIINFPPGPPFISTTQRCSEHPFLHLPLLLFYSFESTSLEGAPLHSLILTTQLLFRRTYKLGYWHTAICVQWTHGYFSVRRVYATTGQWGVFLSLTQLTTGGTLQLSCWLSQLPC